MKITIDFDKDDFDEVANSYGLIEILRQNMITRVDGHSIKKSFLHPTQIAILRLAQTENVGSLRLRDIGRKIGVDHPQKIKHHLQQLIDKGLLVIKENI